MPLRLSTDIFCPEKNQTCPYLHYNSIPDLLVERNYLRQRYNDLEALYNIALQQIEQQKIQINQLKEENEHLTEELNRALKRRFKKNIQKPQDDTQVSQQKSHKKGAPVGHKGTTRKIPQHIDEEIHVSPEHCPNCGSKNLTPCKKVRQHTIQEIIIQPVTIRIHRHYKYCKDCKKVVSVRIKNDLARSYIGPTAKALAAHIRYKTTCHSVN